MRLLIIPFDENLQPIESDIFELESSSKEEIISTLKMVMKDKPYHVEVYKNITNSFITQFGNNSSIAFLNYNKTNYEEKFHDSPYEKSMSLIHSYIEDNGAERLKEFFIKEEKKRKKTEKEKYEKWKKEYDVSHKKEKKSNFKLIALSLVVVSFLFFLGYLIWNDEFRFIGRKTEVKKAVITRIGLMKVPSGGYYQRVTYEFSFNEKRYVNYFTADKFTGMQSQGDTIHVKFRVSNPEDSKRVP